MKLALFLSLFLLSPLVWAAPAPATLPVSFGEWKISSADTQYASGALAQIAGDKAGVLREYGVTAAEQAAYSRGAQSAEVTLYHMADPSAAFGAFTFLRDPQMTPLAVSRAAPYAAAARTRALLVIGNLLLDVVSSPVNRPANQDLGALAVALDSRASHAPYPTIAAFLPPAGLAPSSVRYVLGSMAFAQAFPVGAASQQDWIGFDKNAEAIIASYRLTPQANTGASTALLLVALYPTQQIAAEKYGRMNGWIALNADADSADGRPRVFGKQSGSLVALVAGADSPQAADALLDKIQYSSQITWNAPTHEVTDPGIGTMIVGAITGTGIIMLLAIAAGIGFGGVRIFVKFLFPGKVFDRDEHVEILQLGLSGKRVEAKDFYLIDAKDR